MKTVFIKSRPVWAAFLLMLVLAGRAGNDSLRMKDCDCRHLQKRAEREFARLQGHKQKFRTKKIHLRPVRMVERQRRRHTRGRPADCFYFN